MFGLFVPLKRKTGHEVAHAFSRISIERRAGKMWVDKGWEFYNKDVQKLFELYSTENEEKSCVIERFNRTIKDQIFKYFTANSTRKYIDVLDKLVYEYNNTVHSSVKMSPVKASLKKNENIVWRNIYPEFGGKTVTPKCSNNKEKETFDKGYTQRRFLKFLRFN